MSCWRLSMRASGQERAEFRSVLAACPRLHHRLHERPTRALVQTGMTPLHWAAAFARLELARQLIAGGADVDVEDSACAPCPLRPHLLNYSKIKKNKEKSKNSWAPNACPAAPISSRPRRFVSYRVVSYHTVSHRSPSHRIASLAHRHRSARLRAIRAPIRRNSIGAPGTPTARICADSRADSRARYADRCAGALLRRFQL